MAFRRSPVRSRSAPPKLVRGRFSNALSAGSNRRPISGGTGGRRRERNFPLPRGGGKGRGREESTSASLARDLLAHRQAARPDAASTASLIPCCAALPRREPPPSLPLGRLLAPRTSANLRRVSLQSAVGNSCFDRSETSLAANQNPLSPGKRGRGRGRGGGGHCGFACSGSAFGTGSRVGRMRPRPRA